MVRFKGPAGSGRADELEGRRGTDNCQEVKDGKADT